MGSIIASTLKLEVETTSPRPLIQNRSGQQGLFGWSKNFIDGILVPVSGNTSAINDEGYAFVAPTNPLPASYSVTSKPVPYRPGRYIKIDYKALVVGGTGSTGVTVTAYDAQGTYVNASSLVSDTNLANGAAITFMRDIRFTDASITYVTVRIKVFRAANATATLSQIYVSNDGTATGAPRPTTPQTWANVLGKTNNIITEQGNSLVGVEDALDAGSLTATVLDPALDPSIVSTFRRGRAVRLTATIGGVTTPVWAGTLETCDVEYDDSKTTGKPPIRITLVATDAARKLADASAQFGSTGGFYAMVEKAANLAGLTTFDGAATPAPGTGQIAREDSSKATDWIRRACNTYGGYVWVDGANKVQQRLVTYLSTTPVKTLSDNIADVGALAYTGVAMNYGTRSLVNSLTVRRLNVAEVGDNGAKEYGPYLIPDSESENDRATGSVEIVDGSPSAIAATILSLFATPRVFPGSIRLNTLNDIAGVLALTTYAPIRVKRTVPAYDQVLRVLKVRHEIQATTKGGTWRTTITPRPMETGTAVTVATPTAGADTGPSDVAAPTPGIGGVRRRSGNIAIGNNTYTTLAWDVGSDTYGITWDTSANRWVIPRTGWYDVSLGVRWQTSANGWRVAAIARNGINEQSDLQSGGTFLVNKVSLPMYLAEGDVVSALVFQNSGGSLAVETGLSDSWFRIAFLHP